MYSVVRLYVFYRNFQRVSRKHYTPGCLTRLIKYLNGEPKQLVKTCIYLPADVGYSRAKDPYRKCMDIHAHLNSLNFRAHPIFEQWLHEFFFFFTARKLNSYVQNS